jgi:hypothetical protein
MATEQLLALLKSQDPDLDHISCLVAEQPGLLYAELDYVKGGSALHFAAKYDTKLRRRGVVTALLLQLGADPNQANSAGSIPLYWGFPFLHSCDYAAVRLLLTHEKFDLHQPHGCRGSAWTFIQEEAAEDELVSTIFTELKSARDRSRLALMYCYSKLRRLG